MYVQTLFVLAAAGLAAGQRPTFAGSKPIGFPELTEAAADGLGNRFGEGGDLPLPVEAKGDRDLIIRLSQLPLDKQPFWYINWKALEEQRKNPQTYPQKPNSFIGGNENTQTVNNNRQTSNGLTSKFGESNSDFNDFTQNEYDFGKNQYNRGYRSSRRY